MSGKLKKKLGKTINALRIFKKLYYSTFFQNFFIIVFVRSIIQSKPQKYYYSWFRLFLFRSPLLQESSFLSFPAGTQMFQFPAFPSICYFTHILINWLFPQFEFPHSDIYGLTDICSYPQLFAAYHVLHRLLVPRHSPYALSSLT